jgi:hypothetical protein
LPPFSANETLVKLQTPNSKLQGNSKPQSSNPAALAAYPVIGAGSWVLEETSGKIQKSKSKIQRKFKSQTSGSGVSVRCPAIADGTWTLQIKSETVESSRRAFDLEERTTCRNVGGDGAARHPCLEQRWRQDAPIEFWHLNFP